MKNKTIRLLTSEREALDVVYCLLLFLQEDNYVTDTGNDIDKDKIDAALELFNDLAGANKLIVK